MRQGRVLTDEVRGKIEHLCATMQKPTASKVARKLNLKHGTVYWFMLCNGLVKRKPGNHKTKSYVRNGVTINPYAPEHDDLMIEMRTAGATHQEIAEALVAKFGIPRNAHSVHNRVVMLSAVDDDESEAA